MYMRQNDNILIDVESVLPNCSTKILIKANQHMYTTFSMRVGQDPTGTTLDFSLLILLLFMFKSLCCCCYRGPRVR